MQYCHDIMYLFVLTRNIRHVKDGSYHAVESGIGTQFGQPICRSSQGKHRACLTQDTREQNMKKTFALMLLSFVLSGVSHAQALGSIVGTVTDQQGAGVPSATVKATEVDTNLSRSTTTNADGYFVLPSLRPTQYTINIEAGGFRTTKQALTLLANQTVTVNQQLELGVVTQIVEVQSNALQVNTTNATLGQVVEAQRIEELPLNGRNVAQLALSCNSARISSMSSITRTSLRLATAQER